MSVRLKSRIPEISAELSGRVDTAIRKGTEQIAADAKSRAQSQYQGSDPFNIEAKHGKAKGGDAFGIWANWYWFFGEFGTSHQPAKPYMIPAVEAGRKRVEADVKAELRRL